MFLRSSVAPHIYMLYTRQIHRCADKKKSKRRAVRFNLCWLSVWHLQVEPRFILSIFWMLPLYLFFKKKLNKPFNSLMSNSNISFHLIISLFFLLSTPTFCIFSIMNSSFDRFFCFCSYSPNVHSKSSWHLHAYMPTSTYTPCKHLSLLYTSLPLLNIHSKSSLNQIH